MEGALASGTVLGGRYELVELLGSGGHGAVYRARQRPLGREVAVKVMLPQVAAGHGMSERFAREVSLVQRLEHPNTVRLFDFGTTNDGTAFMVFELLRGRSLEDEMARGPMAPGRAAKIAVQILKSLMEAHALGIVHRDVKPANVLLVDYSGEPDFVKVLDFGVARSMGERSRTPAITSDGQIIGTPAYMAPEQVRGEPLTESTDLYALGIIMGEMLAGEPIYDGATVAEIWMKQASPAPVPIPPRARGSVLGEVVERATRKDARARYAHAAEMLQAIEEALRSAAGAPTAALAPPVMPRAPRGATTAPFASAAPPAMTSVLPPRPMAAASAPSRNTLALVAIPVVLLFAFAVVVLRFASALFASSPHEVPTVPPVPVGTQLVPLPALREEPELDTPFHLRQKATANGWRMQRTWRSERTAGRAAPNESYLVYGPGDQAAVVVVIQYPDDVTAEGEAANLNAKVRHARIDKYVLYLTSERLTPFEERVFEVFRR